MVSHSVGNLGDRTNGIAWLWKYLKSHQNSSLSFIRFWFPRLSRQFRQPDVKLDFWFFSTFEAFLHRIFFHYLKLLWCNAKDRSVMNGFVANECLIDLLNCQRSKMIQTYDWEKGTLMRVVQTKFIEFGNNLFWFWKYYFASIGNLRVELDLKIKSGLERKGLGMYGFI